MRPSWVEVDLGAIRANVEMIVKEVAPAVVCAVVKADAYGHGDVPVAEAALEAGAGWLAVALVEEGVRLREAGIVAPILVLSEPDPADAPEMLRWDLTPTVYSIGFVEALSDAARAASREEALPVHLKVNTGMHRVGADPAAAVDLARRIHRSQNLDFAGLWTHFAVSEEDADYTVGQLDALMAFRTMLQAEGIEPGMLHAANTAGALSYPEARLDMVRVGLGIYGLRPAPDTAPELALRPAMSVHSRVSLVRRLPAGARPSYGRRRALAGNHYVATVPIGYADGVDRRLSQVGGAVIIGTRRFPYAGNITMDQIVVDCGTEPVEPGAEVVVMGTVGEVSVDADEWARLLGTINYEIVCDFGPRLPRRYQS